MVTSAKLPLPPGSLDGPTADYFYVLWKALNKSVGSSGVFVFNVMDYGATGDGLSDDTVALQRAIDAAGAYGDGLSAAPTEVVVFFPPGRYNITSNPFKNRVGLDPNTATRIRLYLQGAVLHASCQIKFPAGACAEGTGGWLHSGYPGSGFQTKTSSYTASVAISSVARVSNVTTVTTSAAHGLESGATVRLEGVTDATFDGGWEPITVTGTTTFTYAYTAADASSSSGTCYIPFVVLGDKDVTVYATRLEKVGIGMRDETGGVALYSNTINEESGAEYLDIQHAGYRGIWLEFAGAARTGSPSGGSLPRAMNYTFQHITVAVTAGVGATGIYIRAFYDNRGFDDVTISTTTLAVNSGAAGLDISGGGSGMYSRFHIEGYTNGVLVGDRGLASAAAQCSSLVLSGITSQDTTTTLVRLRNFGEVRDIVLMGLARNNGTNVLVDEINGVTLTDLYLGFYAIGNTSGGGLLTTSANASALNRFASTVYTKDVLALATNTYNLGNTGNGYKRIVIEHTASQAEGLGLLQTLTATDSPRLFFTNPTDGTGVAIRGSGNVFVFSTGATLGSASGTSRLLLSASALTPAVDLIPDATDTRNLGNLTTGWKRMAVEHGSNQADGVVLAQTVTATDSPRLFFVNTTDGTGATIRGSGSALIFATGATVGSASGTARLTLTATELIAAIPVRTQGYAVGSLPAGTLGMVAHVTDATVVTAKGVAPVAGGTAKAVVFYDGAAWVGI